MSTYRVFYIGFEYTETDHVPAMTEDIWAIVNLAIADGGDAYQQLLRTLAVVAD
ncbi:hypothetical protein [Mycobacterium timonense]|uniref:hypothetical protein n=1 Tax=Mycobacterium timonense TaxID=701043 RepID=UPI001301F3F6|nr:hypothetical protein [Mycobacterium timonense]